MRTLARPRTFTLRSIELRGSFDEIAGFGPAARSPSILLLAVPLAITFRYGVICARGAYLERRFGDAYRDYKARVSRWL